MNKLTNMKDIWKVTEPGSAPRQNGHRRAEFVDLDALATYDVEVSDYLDHDGKKTGILVLDVHLIMKPREYSSGEKIYIGTPHIVTFLKEKYKNIEFESCDKNDVANNVYPNGRDATYATGHWAFRVKDPNYRKPKPRKRETKNEEKQTETSLP